MPLPLARLIEQFERLPGIGRKNAQRLAYHILSMTDEQAKEFADTIVEAKTKIHRCPICCDLTDAELCPICKSPSRDKSVICVVETRKRSWLSSARTSSAEYITFSTG